jgi:hypothetical protein
MAKRQRVTERLGAPGVAVLERVRLVDEQVEGRQERARETVAGEVEVRVEGLGAGGDDVDLKLMLGPLGVVRSSMPPLLERFAAIHCAMIHKSRRKVLPSRVLPGILWARRA